MSLPDATPARAIELCDQLRSVATELRNVLVALGEQPAGLVLKAPEPVPVGKALSRIEAARKCGVSLSTFDAQVRPFLPTTKIGKIPRFLESDLDAWLTRPETVSPGVSHGTPAARRGRRRATETVLDPKALAILGRLKGGKARV